MKATVIHHYPLPLPTCELYMPNYRVNNKKLQCDNECLSFEELIDIVTLYSGVAKPRPTRALARASAHLALASEIDDNHNSLQSMV